MEILKNIVSVIVVGCLLCILCLCISRLCTPQETYAIKTATKQSDGSHYKYVKRKSIDATYIGNSQFLDASGKTWDYEEETNLLKGARCTIIYHDNGTEENHDDVIIEIEKLN